MNKQLIFKKRPIGFPDEQTWSLETTELPTLKDGEVLIQHHYISLDPAMRGWMNDNKSYIPPVGINAVSYTHLNRFTKVTNVHFNVNIVIFKSLHL